MLRLRVRALFRGDTVESELNDELRLPHVRHLAGGAGYTTAIVLMNSPANNSQFA